MVNPQSTRALPKKYFSENTPFLPIRASEAIAKGIVRDNPYERSSENKINEI
jgi:hypothetical protein